MKLTEKCGVFGVYGNKNDVSRMVYYGLWALQHRGQESSGIASATNNQIQYHKSKGLVAHVYNEENLKKLKGKIAIGHNRYSTFGPSNIDHSQPVTNNHRIVALAHNGNLPVVTKLKRFLKNNGIPTAGLNDSEMMHKAIEYWLVKGENLKNAVEKCFDLFTGAFSLLVMTKNELVAVRDKHGIRPLSMGKINGDTFVFSSETCAFDAIGADFIRDVSPGEMIVVNKQGLQSYRLAKNKLKFDIFEFIYFARPDSVLFDKSVYEVRRALGKQLAKEAGINADVIIPVPDSAVPSAIGYSQETKIPLEQALVKNRYIHRTFIKPSKKQRTSSVKMKLNVISKFVKNKNVAIIDDSIVRGTTAKRLVELVNSYDPKEVHMLVSSPPVYYPDFYGIDTPKQKNLIAANMSLKDLQKHIGATTLNYLSYEGMIKAVGINEDLLCTSCFSGVYPIEIGASNRKKLSQITKVFNS